MERSSGQKNVINNDFYETLHDSWYTATDHPIALLRAENRARGKWISTEISQRIGKSCRILDVGCGAGFLSNTLSTDGHVVTGIDISASSIEIARAHDSTSKVNYLVADAYDLPFADESFDVVCAMDILEHVERPERLIKEASRVLTKGGLFFFHTFNRNFLSYFIVIKGVDWFVRNAPPNMHVYELFIKPEELMNICEKENLQVKQFVGLVPTICSFAFWKMLFTGHVSENFEFSFAKTLSTGYCGIAKKN